jgi:hypothetical protein
MLTMEGSKHKTKGNKMNKQLTYSDLVDIALILNHEEISLMKSTKVLGDMPEIVAIHKREIKKVKLLRSKIHNMMGNIK